MTKVKSERRPTVPLRCGVKSALESIGRFGINDVGVPGSMDEISITLFNTVLYNFLVDYLRSKRYKTIGTTQTNQSMIPFVKV